MKRLLTALVGLMLVAGTTADAAEMKIGVVNLGQISQQSTRIETMNKNLQAQFKPQQEKIIAAQKNIQTEAQKLNSDQAKNLKPAEVDAIKKKMAADQKQLQQMVVTFQQGLAQARAKATKAYIDTVTNTVKMVAEKNHLSLVLMKPAVIYSANTQDITQQVLMQLPKEK